MILTTFWWLSCVSTTPGHRPPPDPVTVGGAVDLVEVRSEVDPVYGTLLRVHWTQSAEAKVHLEYSFDQGEWRSSPEMMRPAGAHQEVVLGAPYDSEVAWRLVAEHEQGTVETPTLATWSARRPEVLPRATVLVSDPSQYDAAMPYVLVSVSYDGAFHGEHAVVVLDREGRVVWFHPSERRRSAMHPRIALGGNAFMFDQSSLWGGQRDGGAASYVVEMAIDGTVLQRWDTPGLYHAFTGLPDGGLAYPSSRRLDRDGDEGERIMVQAADGSERELLRCDQVVEQGCASNTLTYDAERNVFLYSLFTLEEVWEVGAQDGAVRRRFGQTSPTWSFEPASSGFWFQHGPVYTDDGTLLVSTHRGAEDEELVVREYEVDEDSRVLRQVWSFGEGQGVTGTQMGEAHRLPGGNTLHNYGTHAVLREVNPQGEVVWEIRWEDQEFGGSGPRHAIGRSAPVLTTDLYQFRP